MIDLFADEDLSRQCTVRRIYPENYPYDLVQMQAQAPAGPVIFTGALENHSRILAKLARVRPLWGNGPEIVQRVRSPFALTQVLAERGLPCPAVGRNLTATARRRWLSKPRRGAGGRNIHFWRGEPIRTDRYLQEWIGGEPCAAVFLAGRDDTSLLGATRQLVGCSWLHGAPFHYCGSIGPLPLDERSTNRLRTLGNAIADTFALCGLFGIDFILRDGIPWPVEVNPRYTASVEVVERATGVRALGLHARVFEPSIAPPKPLNASKEIHGKAILFAEKGITFPQAGPWSPALLAKWDLQHGPEFADIPAPGMRIKVGQPVLTVFARATSINQCELRLREIAAVVYRALSGPAESLVL